MAYPAPSDYLEVLQDPEAAFADPELARGEVATNALGLPQPITGAFAAVFRVASGEKAYAVRCFLSASEDRQARYRAAARHLAGLDLPALLPFEFQPKGVRVVGSSYPLVKMEWVEGEPLDAFVARHLDRPDVLRALAEAWRVLLRDLEAAGVAHGDLQHGNVLVQAREDGLMLRLVDYDALFVPSLRGRSSPEVGHRNFQHPDRTEDDFGPTLDRFAGLVIYTALTALAERPDLWEQFSTGENLLFQASDFYDPEGSALFAALREIPDVRPLADALATACYLEPVAAPALEDVLRGEAPEGGRRPRRRQEGGRRPRRRQEGGASGGGRWALPALGGGLALALVVAILGEGGLGLLLALLAVSAVAVAGVGGYRRLSAVRRRHRLAREATVLERWIADLEDERQELLRERADVAGHIQRFREIRLRELQEDALDRRLRHHFVGELEGVVTHQAVVRLKVARIRTAFQATPERVAAAKGLTSEERARIGAWRGALVERYAEDVPEALSPAEEQRLRRQVERQVASLTTDIARVQAKKSVQQGELARVHAQADALPAITPGIYARYLLRLTPLPPPGPPMGEQQPPPPEAATPPAPPLADTEAPWWRQS